MTARSQGPRLAGRAVLAWSLSPVVTLGAFGCPGCACTPVACESGDCHCPCCCIHNYPLPAFTAVLRGGA